DSLFLRDRTGNRRFWPIEVGIEPMVKDFADFDEEVDQVWAEAYKLYKEGETLYLDAKVEAEARKQQDRHSEESEKTGLIQEYLEHKLPESWADMNLYERRDWLESDEVGTVDRHKVCVAEIWCEVFGGDPKNLNSLVSREINGILRRLPDWEDVNRLKFGKLYGQQRAFVRWTNETK
ncbi:MAG: VapE family protein, partial [Christensenellaceae bacterium]